MSYNFGNPLYNQHQSYLGGASDPTEFLTLILALGTRFFKTRKEVGLIFLRTIFILMFIMEK